MDGSKTSSLFSKSCGSGTFTNARACCSELCQSGFVCSKDFGYVEESPVLKRLWQTCYSNILSNMTCSAIHNRPMQHFTSSFMQSWTFGKCQKIENMMKLYLQGIAMDTACYVWNIKCVCDWNVKGTLRLLSLIWISNGCQLVLRSRVLKNGSYQIKTDGNSFIQTLHFRSQEHNVSHTMNKLHCRCSYDYGKNCSALNLFLFLLSH